MTVAAAAFWNDRSAPASVVCGTSAWNGLGFTPHQIWAFKRAGLTALAGTPFRLQNGTRATMAPIRTLPLRPAGLDRMIPVARALMRPHVERLSKLPRRTPVALVLCLSERFGAEATRERQQERQRLEAALIGPLVTMGMEPLFKTVARGHAGLAFALADVGNLLAAEKIEAALLGGVDTYWDAELIDALQAERRIFDSEKIERFIPGEGGAFFLVARRNRARSFGWPVMARLEATSTAIEPQPMRAPGPCAAEGLSAAMRAIADRMEAERRTIDYWLGDVTHEPYRVHEWLLASPRAAVGVSGKIGWTEFLPPILGDLGAATLATEVVLATEAFVRGDPPASTCVASASSVGPERGAVLLSRIVDEEPARARPVQPSQERSMGRSGAPVAAAAAPPASRPRAPLTAPPQPGPTPYRADDPARMVGFFPAQPRPRAPSPPGSGPVGATPPRKQDGSEEGGT